MAVVDDLATLYEYEPLLRVAWAGSNGCYGLGLSGPEARSAAAAYASILPPLYATVVPAFRAALAADLVLATNYAQRMKGTKPTNDAHTMARCFWRVARWCDLYLLYLPANRKGMGFNRLMEVAAMAASAGGFYAPEHHNNLRPYFEYKFLREHFNDFPGLRPRPLAWNLGVYTSTAIEEGARARVKRYNLHYLAGRGVNNPVPLVHEREY